MTSDLRSIPVLVVAAVLAGCASVGPGTAENPTGAVNGVQPGVEIPTVQAPDGSTAFRVDDSQSEVRFVIGEILGGEPNTVVGVNQQVSGSAYVVFDEPGASVVGAFVIEASSFQTDSNLRNRAINQFILQSGSFPTIVFVPTSITGLPDSAATGDRLDVQIGGELTIRDVTQPVTFEVRLMVISDSHLQATGSATIARSDFELQIPRVQRVAGVNEEFILEFDMLMIAG